MAKLTIKAVNKRLKEDGWQDLKLHKGKDYLYFYGADADGWRQQGVYVPRLNDLAMDQWLREAKELAKDKL